MAMALTRWGASPFHHIHLTNASTTTGSRYTRTLQVTCRAQTSTDHPKKKKKVEKPSGKKKEPGDKEDKEGFSIVDMSQWINNKPSGFGVGKEYNTSLEEELLTNIQKEEELRAAAEASKGENESKPKTTERKKSAKKEAPKPMQRITLLGDKVVERKTTNKPKVEKEPQEEEPAGVKVKLTHLPKKKNIRKDLRDAFKDVHGLLFIKPNELANKKTRDPLCKGSALLTFANEEKAKFFIEKFKARKLSFGKVDKVITYELLPEKVEPQAEEVTKPVPRLQVRETVADVVTVVSEELVSNSLDEHETEDEDEAEDDVVLDAIVSASLDEDTDDESLEEDDEDEDGEVDEADEDDELELTARAGFEGMEISDDLEYVDSDDDDEFTDEEEEHEDTTAGMDVSDEYTDDEDEEFHVDEEEQEPDLPVNEEGYVEVDVSLPLTVKDLGGDPEEIIQANTEKMEELDKQISQLKKKLKRKKSAALEARILKLREEKIELLEKRVLARFVVARDAFRAKKAAKQQERDDAKRNGRYTGFMKPFPR